MQDLVSVVNSFGDSFTSKLRGLGINSSFFLSPFALTMSLLLLANTVQNTTRAEIMQSLNLTHFGLDQINEYARSSLQDYLNAKLVCINNAVWTSKFPFTANFKSVCMDKYFAAAYICSRLVVY
jgi:hypothetical protein